MRQMHAELIDMLDGEIAQLLYDLAPGEEQIEESNESDDDALKSAAENWNRAEDEYWCAAFGEVGGGKGGKGNK